MEDPGRPPQTTNALQAPAHRPETTVVGIGASAGGLSALKTFFHHVAEDTGLAFVVVMHLSPKHESHLAELLQPHVRMPVQQVSATTPLEANRVYVIPPNANLSTIDTHLRLTELEEQRRERAPIDHFFRTLARTHDGHAIAVVLTGTGSDGTLGVKEIKERGGLVVVQDPNEAEFDGMPQSALSTGLVDLVLPLAEVPEAILRFARTEPKVPVPPDDEDVEDQVRRLLHHVFAQVRARTGRDFSQYKRSTILRRIQRRMQLRYVEELSQYLELLRKDAAEVRALADDFLITVTNFFRDAEVFEQLEQEVIPQLFEGKGEGDAIRVWSVGCATGEEVYSLTMLLLEEAARREARGESLPHVQVFASDLHERSLAKAREGFYPGDIATEIAPERLQRFFDRENGGYRIRKDVRELIVFAPHNLLGDPPFSRVDLIACRNVLIYLQRAIQQEVVELFHYALKPDGWLVLGTSETVESSELFRLASKRHCLYRKRNVPPPEVRLPVFPLSPGRLPGPRDGRKGTDELAGEAIAYGALHQRLVEMMAPPSLLVSPDDKVVHLSERVGRYLVPAGGTFTSHVFKLIREELRIELRAALHVARDRGEATQTKPLPVRIDGALKHVVLQVRPALEPQQDGYVLVLIDEWAPSAGPAPLDEDRPPEAPDDEHTRRVEAELKQTRQRLQALIEEYETGQEEMKASNEELQSANEELRSTLEELETSKEELQSMNEELQTVNQENRHKVEELAQLSGDLQNLMAATQIATIFLDRDLRILRFTPRVADLFNVRMTDRGRPVSDLTHRLRYDELRQDARHVLARLVPVEREVRDEAGQWYLTRVLPYRSQQDRIEGVVITFIDITRRRTAEAEVRRNEERKAFLLGLSDALRPLTDSDAILREACRRLAEHVGARRAFVVQLGDAGDVAVAKQDYAAAGLPSLAGAYPASARRWLVPRLEQGRPVVVDDLGASDLVPEADREAVAAAHAAWIAVPLAQDGGRLLGALCVAEPEPRAWTELEIDVAGRTAERVDAALARAAAEKALRESEARFRGLVDASAQMVWTTNDRGRVVADSPSWRDFTGQTYDEWTGRGWLDAVHPDDRGRVEAAWQQAVAAGEPFKLLLRVYHAGSGRYRWTSVRAVPLRADDGTIREWVGMNIDVTELKEAEEALLELNETLEARVAERTLQVRHLTRRLTMAEQEERRRISQILHDDLQQLLYGVEMKMGVARKALLDADHQDLAETINEGRAWVEQAVNTTRQLTVDLSPPILHDEGLTDALRWLQRQMRELHGLEVTLEAQDAFVLPDDDLRVLLFQIVRELLFNVKKHAGTDRAVVHMEEQTDHLVIHVVDEGRGFDVAEVREREASAGGFGLYSVRERLQLLGGRMEVRSRPGGGTHVTIHAPEDPAAA